MDKIASIPRYNRLHDISPSNVASSVVVGISRVAAQATLKLSLALSVGLFAMPALRTGAAGIASVNQTKGHAVANGAVGDELPQLIETPAVVLSPLRLSQPYPVSDARKVFEFQFSTGAFSRFNEVLRNLVVGIASETSLTARELFKVALSRPRAAPLQVGSQLGIALAGRFYKRAAIVVAIRVGRQVFDAEVYTERARRFLRRLVSKLAVQVDVPLALLSPDELPTLDTLSSAQEVPLIPADLERDREPPVNRGQRDNFVLDFDAEDALVIVNRGGLEAAGTFPLALADSRYSPDRKVGTQAKLSPYVLVGQLLQGKLREVLLRSSDSQNMVARCRKSVYRPAQALSLARSGYQFAADAQEAHNYG